MPVRVPYRYITGLEARAREELRRNFEEITTFLDNLPSVFVVVDAEGSGDYTSIKEAVEAQPEVGSTTSQAATYIWVKPSSTDYSDNGDGQVDVGNRRVIVFAAWPNGDRILDRAQVWNMDGFVAASTEIGHISVVGMDLVLGTSESLMNGAGTMFLEMDHTVVSQCLGIFGDCASANLRAKDSDLSNAALFSAGTTATGPRSVTLLDTGAVLRASGSSPPSLTALSDFNAVGGSLTLGGSLTTSSSTISSGSGQYRLCNVFLAGGVANQTWSAVADAIEITGCGSTADGSTINFTLNGYSSTNGGDITLAGNSMREATITLQANTHGSIHGVYRSIVLNGNETAAFVHLNLLNSGTAVTITGDRNYVVAAIANTGGSAQAVSISAAGDNNIVLYSGSGFGTADSDSGSGNLINSIPGAPTGAAGGDLAGSYPNPTVQDDSHAHTSTTLPADIVYDADLAALELDDLDDVVIAAPAAGENLEFDGTDWINSPTRYTETIGDGATTAFSIVHNLGDDVHVAVIELASGEYVFPLVEQVDVDEVTVTFTVAPGTDAFNVKVTR